MNAFERHTDPPNEAIACLVRIQQVLLHKGYKYVAGDRKAWPDTPVQMIQDESLILIAPYYAGTVDEVLNAWDQNNESIGLLLVGTIEVDAPEIDRLLAHKRPKGRRLAYIDAQRRQFRTPMKFWSLSSAGKDALQPGNIKAFLNRDKCKSSANADCLSMLKKNLMEAVNIERFVRAAARASSFRGPWLTIGMIVVFCGVMAIMTAVYGLKMLYDPSPGAFMDWGALHGPLVRIGQWWRMFSVALTHGGPMHLLCNCLFMLIFGMLLEMHQGSSRTFLYFTAGVGFGSVASLWWNPSIVGVGASGGLFGLIGALAAMIIRYRREFPKHLWNSWRKLLLTVLLYNALYMFRPNIDTAAHIGGLIGGFAAAIVLSRSPVKIAWPRAWVWPAILAVLLSGLFLGRHVIANIPADTPMASREINRYNSENTLADSLDSLNPFSPDELKQEFAILAQIDEEMRIRRKRLNEFRNGTRPLPSIRNDLMNHLGSGFVKKLESWRQQLVSKFARKAVHSAILLNTTQMEHCRLLIAVSNGVVSRIELLNAELVLTGRENDYERELAFAHSMLTMFQDI